MRKLNKNAIRFGLGVMGVALGTTMLGHLAPVGSGTAAGTPQAAPPAPPVTPVTPTVPAAAAPGGVPAFVPAVIEYQRDGGRVIILGQSTAVPLAAASLSPVPAQAPAAVSSPGLQAPVRSGRPPVRTRRS